MIHRISIWLRHASGPFAIALAAACLALPAPALAQGSLQGSGPLIRQDGSDCVNSTVRDTDPARIGGTISITQTPAGATTATVGIIHGTPSTAYNFYWKCHNQLGTIQTNADGAGMASFQFRAPAGQLLAFDMYPNGAPLGNKFQSVPITPAYIGLGPLVRQDFSDCGNNNVNAGDPSRIGGILILEQAPTGATTANVEISHGTPNTAYTLYWKCQRALGTVQTDGNGVGTASFQFQAPVGQVLTFDMYPAGAPPGNKFQSVRIVPAPGRGRATR